MIDFILMLIIAIMSLLLDHFEAGNPNIEQIVVVVCIFLFGGFYNWSLGPYIWTYNAEILPAAGVSIATSVNWGGNTIIGFSYS